MSGGSYDFLCYVNSQTIMEKTGRLIQMADRLAELGYAKDAAIETHALLLEIKRCEIRLQAVIDRLASVWKAVEWWDSADSTEEGVKEALALYRGEK